MGSRRRAAGATCALTALTKSASEAPRPQLQRRNFVGTDSYNFYNLLQLLQPHHGTRALRPWFGGLPTDRLRPCDRPINRGADKKRQRSSKQRSRMTAKEHLHYLNGCTNIFCLVVK